MQQQLWTFRSRMVPAEKLADGETVVLIDGRGRRYLKRLRAGHRITVRGTVIESNSLIGLPEGSLAGAGEAERFRVFRPSYAELASAVERPAEPIFAKDVGTLLVRAGIGAGARVVESGVGAGTLSVALLTAIGPGGALSSYEIRADFAEIAQTNVAAYRGASPNWRVVVRDARDGFDERAVDAVILDMPDPDQTLSSAARSLRPGGTLAVYVPTVLQIKQLYDALEGSSAFTSVETLETLERSWQVAGRSIRPDHRMVAHTGFLTFARRTADDH